MAKKVVKVGQLAEAYFEKWWGRQFPTEKDSPDFGIILLYHPPLELLDAMIATMLAIKKSRKPKTAHGVFYRRLDTIHMQNLAAWEATLPQSAA